MDEHDWMGAYVGAGVFAFLVALACLVYFLDAREWGGVGALRRSRIYRSGIAASAEILDEMTRPSLFGGRHVVTFAAELILRVHPPTGEPYEAVTRMIRTAGEGLYVAKGETVPVRIDRDGTVLVDVNAARSARLRRDDAARSRFEERVKEIEGRR